MGREDDLSLITHHLSPITRNTNPPAICVIKHASWIIHSFMHFRRSILAVSIAAVSLTSFAAAQTKRAAKPVTKKPLVTSVAPTPSPSPVEPVVVSPEPKKNERPGG